MLSKESNFFTHIGCREANEDHHMNGEFDHKLFGCIKYKGIFDGHGGSQTSKLISMTFNDIFITSLNETLTCVSESDTISQIVFKSFTLLNDKLIKLVRHKYILGRSGTTVIVYYYFQNLNKLFVFNMGDGRFICTSKSTKSITKNLVSKFDIFDQSFVEYEMDTKEAVNYAQFFPNLPLVKPEHQELKLGQKYEPGSVFEKYYIPGDRDNFALGEWDKLLQCNDVRNIGFKKPMFNNNAVRFIGLQPTTSLESTTYYQCLSKGYVLEINITDPKDILIFIGCDGFEDSDTMTYQDIVDFIYNPSIKPSEIMKNQLFSGQIYHPYYTTQLDKQIEYMGDVNTMSLVEDKIDDSSKLTFEINDKEYVPRSDLTTISLITWMKTNIVDNPKFIILDGTGTFKSSIHESINYFYSKLKSGDMFSGSKIQDLTFKAILCGSTDNVSGSIHEL